MATAGIKIIPIRRRKGPSFDGAQISRDLQGATRDTVSEGHRFIAKYPPQRLGKSGYRRTGTLKRSWDSRTISTPTRIEGIVGSNSNMAPYNRPVQGSPQVAAFRSAGWRGVDDLEKMVQDGLEERVQRVIDRIPN